MIDTNWIDDKSIQNDENLWRRIHPVLVVPNENLGQRRLSSAAFNDPEMSVYIETRVRQSGRSEADILTEYHGYGLASITAGLARDNGQAVVSDPQIDEPAHGLVAGVKSRSVRRAFAQGSIWVVEVP